MAKAPSDGEWFAALEDSEKRKRVEEGDG